MHQFIILDHRNSSGSSSDENPSDRRPLQLRCDPDPDNDIPFPFSIRRLFNNKSFVDPIHCVASTLSHLTVSWKLQILVL